MHRSRNNKGFQLRSGNKGPFNRLSGGQYTTNARFNSAVDATSPVQRGPHVMDSPLHSGPKGKLKVAKQLWDKAVDWFKGGGGEKTIKTIKADKRIKNKETVIEKVKDAYRKPGWKEIGQYLPWVYVAADFAKDQIGSLTKGVTYTLEEVQQMIKDAKKADGGNKKNVDKTQEVKTITPEGDTVKIDQTKYKVTQEK